MVNAIGTVPPCGARVSFVHDYEAARSAVRSVNLLETAQQSPTRCGNNCQGSPLAGEVGVAGRCNGDRETSIRTSHVQQAVALIAVLGACLVGCSSSNSQPRRTSASSAEGKTVGVTSAASTSTVAAGSANVTVNGHSYAFSDSLTCTKPACYRKRGAMGAIAGETSSTPAVLEVDKTTDGDDVQLVSIVFGGNLWGSGHGAPGGASAPVRNEGNSYTVTGTAFNAITKVVAPFEID